jgi:hypothetical protein
MDVTEARNREGKIKYTAQQLTNLFHFGSGNNVRFMFVLR